MDFTDGQWEVPEPLIPKRIRNSCKCLKPKGSEHGDPRQQTHILTDQRNANSVF